MHVWLSHSFSPAHSHTWQHFTFIVAVVCVCGGGERGGGKKVPVMAGETRKRTVQTVRATWPQVLSCLSCLLCNGTRTSHSVPPLSSPHTSYEYLRLPRPVLPRRPTRTAFAVKSSCRPRAEMSSCLGLRLLLGAAPSHIPHGRFRV